MDGPLRVNDVIDLQVKGKNKWANKMYLGELNRGFTCTQSGFRVYHGC